MRPRQLRVVFRGAHGCEAGQHELEHRVHPYLLRAVAVERLDQVWCADITYVPVRGGFPYLVAVMDWATHFVLSWRLSNTLDAALQASRRSTTPSPAERRGVQHRHTQRLRFDATVTIGDTQLSALTDP